MTVIGAIPIQIPVHRIRVRAKCLAIGGPVHAAVLRLADLWGGDSPEEIAEVLGLPINRVERLLRDLERGGQEIEREFVLWVDHARRRCLPHDALTGVAVKRAKSEPLTLPADHPTPTMVEHMGLEAGLAWDLGIEGSAQVLDVLDVVVDIRDRSLPHELRMPDTQLVIAHNDTTEEQPWEFSVTQYGVEEPLLTHWAREHHTDYISTVLMEAHLDPAQTPPQQLTQLTSRHTWDEQAPHPELVRGQITQAAEDAEQRVVLCAPDLRSLPAWLEEALCEASDRDIEVLLCPSQADYVPSKADFEFNVSASTQQSGALAIVADEGQAVLYSHPTGCLADDPTPVRQYLYSTRARQAIGDLLDRLHLKRLRLHAPLHKISPEKIASMLRQELDKLQAELPATLQVTIQPADEQFALETIDRQRTPENPTKAAWRAAAGIAWERVLTERVRDIIANHDDLKLLRERWVPPNVKIDLDLILADNLKGITWILDAKNTDPNHEQLRKMLDQIRLLQNAPQISGGRPIMGVIVHRKHQLSTPIKPTDHHNILRCTPHGLHQLLLSKTLPGERHQPQTRPKAA
jgi:hypothetical protein